MTKYERLIAISLVMSYPDRMARIRQMSAELDALRGSIGAGVGDPSGVHGSMPGDPVSVKAGRALDISLARDREQERINAVDYAYAAVLGDYAEADRQYMRQGIDALLAKNTAKAEVLVMDKLPISINELRRAKNKMLLLVLKYLDIA